MVALQLDVDYLPRVAALDALKDLPVDILKIDLKFLADTHEDDQGRGSSILTSVVRMAKWLRVPVIAEGVETKSQANSLRRIGCQCVQGFFYSRPVPVPVYEEMVTKGFELTAGGMESD